MVSPVSVSLAKRPNVLVVSGEGFGTIARGFDSRQLHQKKSLKKFGFGLALMVSSGIH